MSTPSSLSIDLAAASLLIGREFQPWEREVILGLLSERPQFIMWGMRSGKTRLGKEAERVWREACRGHEVTTMIVDEFPLDISTPNDSDQPLS